MSSRFARACYVGLTVGDLVVVRVARRRRITLRCGVCEQLLEADERNVLEDGAQCPHHDPTPGVDPGAYRRAHNAVRAARGDPAGYTCVWCSRPAQEWAHDDRHDPDGVTSGGYPYSWNPDHYRPACIRHHRRAPHWRDRDAYGAVTLWEEP